MALWQLKWLSELPLGFVGLMGFMGFFAIVGLVGFFGLSPPSLVFFTNDFINDLRFTPVGEEHQPGRSAVPAMKWYSM